LNLEKAAYHADDGAGAHVLDEAGEERLGGEIGVVLLQQLLGGCGHLQSDQLEALLLEALDDLANQTALNAVGPEEVEQKNINDRSNINTLTTLKRIEIINRLQPVHT
jgi:hypothetical protein